MIKRTLYFGNPCYLTLKDNQLQIKIRNELKEEVITRPIEDIALVMIDHPQITLSHNVIKELQAHKVVIVSCDDRHMPHSIMLPMKGHTEQSKRYRTQLKVSQPLKKNLWQQTVVAKINNQKEVLRLLDKPYGRLEVLAKRVQSGDPDNIEAQAAAYYWATYLDDFIRDRYGEPPNHLLNYGYAVLRAMIARALVSSGLLLTTGIHHKNKYNAFCLADDIMEPYRPFVDAIVYDMYINLNLESFLDTSGKQQLLSLGEVDAQFGKKRRPLMVGMAFTTSSLYQCFAGKKRKLQYPTMI